MAETTTEQEPWRVQDAQVRGNPAYELVRSSPYAVLCGRWQGDDGLEAAQAEADRLNARERMADAGEVLAKFARLAEWSGERYLGGLYSFPACPECNGVRPASMRPDPDVDVVGHRPDCALAAALAKAEPCIP